MTEILNHSVAKLRQVLSVLHFVVFDAAVIPALLIKAKELFGVILQFSVVKNANLHRFDAKQPLVEPSPYFVQS
ncbi:MAG TPA: hypothetical protein VF556_08725 [Pyrinomonadaceae bacterium]